MGKSRKSLAYQHTKQTEQDQCPSLRKNNKKNIQIILGKGVLTFKLIPSPTPK